MRVTVEEVAALVGGRVIGDGTTELTGISGLQEAEPGDITFLANPKYTALVAETKASAVLVSKDQEAEVVQIIVANPDYAFAQVVEHFGPRPRPMAVGVHPAAIIGEGVELGEGVTIGAYAVVADGATVGAGSTVYPHAYLGSDSALGEGCIIYPHVTVRENCQLGNRVILHAGAVIGADGFGYATVEGVHHKIPQVGRVVVGDDVEIGANTCIDRARFGTTVIGSGTKIDNLVQIAHNVTTGDHCIIVAQVGVAGSTGIGRHVTLCGQSAINGHITIGDQAIVTARAGVSKSIPAKAVVQGIPAQPMKQHQLQEVALRRLPRTQETVKQLLKRVADLEARLEAAEGGREQA